MFRILTTVIGFLVGYILYLVIEPSTTLIFLFGGFGYITGIFLETNDQKRQFEAFHPSSMLSTHEFFHFQELPEAVVIYSAHDNTTSVLLDYRIEAKPENYRLSVLKNLQEFDFRIIEDTSQTFFSLCIEYPEFNYSSIKENHKERTRFLYDIEERSNDFKGAIHKLIPGIVINSIQNPDIFGYEVSKDNNVFEFSHYSFPPSSPKTNPEEISNESETSQRTYEENEMEIEPEQFETNSLDNQKTEKSTITEENILQDLNKPAEGRFNEGMATFFPDQYSSEEIESDSESEGESKKPSFLTAKQIEESQDFIKTKKKDIDFETRSSDSRKDKESVNGIFDYSSLDSSSSMPMDTVGQSIMDKLNDFMREREARLSKVKEKVSTKES